VTKYLVFGTCLVFGCGGLNAQQTAWQPSPGHTQVPIWPGAVPDAPPVARPEVATAENKSLVAGRAWVGVGSPLLQMFDHAVEEWLLFPTCAGMAFSTAWRTASS
jgi:hypothetical protein